MFKKFLIFILCLIPWFLNNILPIDYKYFNQLSLPFFTPPTPFYSISWILIYILLAITIYNIFISYKFKEIPISYKISLLINYLFNQSYPILFFNLKNPFLGLISATGIFISTLFLYEETSLLESKQSKLLTPYLLLSLFALVISISIYLIN